MAKIIDGREIARKINEDVKEKIDQISSSVGQTPRLVSLLAGNSADAEIYIGMQEKTARFVGIEFRAQKLDAGITQEDLIRKIEELNADETVTAIIVQKPLPDGINHDRICESILPEKDAEGIHPYNLGRILRREADIVPCTPGAIMKVLRVHDVELYGKEVVIIGHSAIVGKPLSLMMLNETATTTVCHIGTAERGSIEEHAKKADVLVVAVGNPEMVRGNWIKKGAVVVDVGINRVDDRIVGDVNAAEAFGKASMISPVPGGVGPVTVSILLRNVFRAYRNQYVKT